MVRVNASAMPPFTNKVASLPAVLSTIAIARRKRAASVEDTTPSRPRIALVIITSLTRSRSALKVGLATTSAAVRVKRFLIRVVISFNVLSAPAPSPFSNSRNGAALLSAFMEVSAVADCACACARRLRAVRGSFELRASLSCRR